MTLSTTRHSHPASGRTRRYSASDHNLDTAGALDFGLRMLEREADEAREETERLTVIIKRLAGVETAVRS